ncbi:hypothetical protein [Halomonas denitrificans]|nr:hypothetical protein [Halomonas denitrificans]
MQLIAELKRRNVFRVGLFYIVSAWLIVQVAETLLPIFDVPDGALRAIVLILVLGFVPALVFAWAFELTPEGLKRDKNVERVDPDTKRQTSRKLNLATLIAAVLAIGVVVADRMLPESTRPDVEPASAPTDPPERISEDARNSVSAAVATPEPADRSSIAVLAFENMSPDPDNAFFAEGISEEILNVLAGVEGLRVASRTSAFSFTGRGTPIPEIARQLNVGHVLEGSVRKAGNRVRITAQLIDASNDAHLWSDSYDRELDNIFAVQEEIAESITTALASILDTESVNVAAPTDDLTAYQDFLRGRSRFYQRVMLDEAIGDLRGAVDADPDFAQAWAFLAAAEYVVGDGGYPTELDQEALTRSSAESVDRALRLDPENVIAQAIKGQQLFDAGNRVSIEEGLAMLESAASRVSPDSTARLWLGLNLLQLGLPERAFDVLEQAQAQDPLVAINNGYLGVAHAVLGRQEPGRRFALRAVELSGSLTFWSTVLVIEAANSGDTTAAIELLDEVRSAIDGDAAFQSALIEGLTERYTLEQLMERHPELLADGLADFFRTNAGLVLGEIDTALAEAYGSVSGPRYSILHSAWMPSMVALREHPGFFAWTRELGFVDYWRIHGFPLDCGPIVEGGVERLECGGAD